MIGLKRILFGKLEGIFRKTLVIVYNSRVSTLLSLTVHQVLYETFISIDRATHSISLSSASWKIIRIKSLITLNYSSLRPEPSPKVKDLNWSN